MVTLIALAATVLAPREPQVVNLKVGELDRTFWSYPSTTTKAAPTIFCFHGHGGNARYASRAYDFQNVWPEANVIYLQGLPIAGKTDPEGKKNGWQRAVGDAGDRDLKFFDATLDWAKKNLKVDSKRLFAMGHSNGGMFTYLLWMERADVFAGFAPCAAVGLRTNRFVAKPAIVVGGTEDTIVSYAMQKRTMDGLIRKFDMTINSQKQEMSFYTNPSGMEFATYIFEGGHTYPTGANQRIADFFKRQHK
ncbi:MAG: prolyl oligopeptidase family serine peptidase [Armatimonadetes bacterium]|nr:prolyl oligopeptidase family serine peptidase [Armatimonadota bacterium]